MNLKAMRFPRAIRLDTSDLRIYEVIAEPGESGVLGAFAFANADPETLTGKAPRAFVHGILGPESSGRTTRVEISETVEAADDMVVIRRANHFVANQCAPDRAAAMPAAREERAFAASLFNFKIHTLLAVERDSGALVAATAFLRAFLPRPDMQPAEQSCPAGERGR